MDRLIYKYLQNKLSREEKMELEAWLDESPDNVRLFKNFVGHWSLTDFDVELMKYKIWQRIPKERTPAQANDTSFKKFAKIFWRVAAVLVIGLSISYYFLAINPKAETTTIGVISDTIEKEAGRGQKLTIKLPDGSMVKLNADSRLLYPANFTGQTRKVALTGEAFFDIARNEEKPFIIESGELNVEVLGTSFNVHSYPNQKEISVAVRSGKVSVKDLDKTMETLLTSNEKLVLSSVDGSFRKETITDGQMAYGWIDNYLSFHDRSLEEAMELVSKWFDVEYQIHNRKNFTNKFITAKFNNPTLKNVMENLSYSYEFKYEINENEIMIK